MKELDGIVEQIVRYQLSRISAASGAEIVAKQKELADYQAETIKVIRGESRLDIDLLND